MEDLFSILTTICFVVIAVAVKANKTMRQRAAAEQEQGEVPEYIPVPGWPATSGPEPKPAKPMPGKHPIQRQAKRTAPQKLHPDSQESLDSRELAAGRNRHTGSATNLRTEPSQEQHPDMADFDLRKAVIWSEILQPKFREE